MTPRNSEPMFNEAVCQVLWTIRPGPADQDGRRAQEGALIPRGKPGLVVPNGTMSAAVGVESEYLPASTVEDDARKRVNARLAESEAPPAYSHHGRFE